MSELNPEDYEQLKQNIDEHIKKQTPLPGNICHTCKKEVVKKVTGLFRGKFIYSFPECTVCGRVYFYANNVRTVGEAEFLKILNQPFTI